jgi:AraC family ethanolamine operon transcriptional activator
VAVKAVSHFQFGPLCRAAKAVPGWVFDFAQLEGGPCAGEMLSLQDGPFQFIQMRMDRSVRRGGTTPAGQFSLAMHAQPKLFALTHGETYGDDVIVLTPGGSQLDSVSHDPTNLFAVSVREDVFRSMLEEAGWPLPEGGPGSVRLLTPPAGKVAQLREALWLVREMAVDGQCGAPLWHLVSACLVDCLASLGSPGRTPPDSRRRRVAAQGIAYILDNLASPVKLADICRVAGVSERTLIYAFKEYLGITPKAFLNISRLNRVRRELECARVASVTDAATLWGFWHMGQFSADYKRFFGELPSQTLARSRQGGR